MIQATLERYDLKQKLEQLRFEAAKSAHGHATMTLAKNADTNLVLLALQAQAELLEHTAPGVLNLLILEGRIVFSAQGQELELNQHDLVTLGARVGHALKALEPSAVLLTIAIPKV